MNVRAKCLNEQCPEFGVTKPVTLETYAGQGAPNERIICRTCGQLMRTTKTVDITAKVRIKPFKRLVQTAVENDHHKIRVQMCG